MVQQFWKGKIFKSPSGIRTHNLQICSLRSDPLHCAVKGNNFEKEIFMKLDLILLFISIGSMS